MPIPVSSSLKPVFFRSIELVFHKADYLVKTNQLVNKKLHYFRKILLFPGKIRIEACRTAPYGLTANSPDLSFLYAGKFIPAHL